MWDNSLQDPFVLEGFNAKFYLEITQDAVNRLTDLEGDVEPDYYTTGCVLFDQASIEQKVYLIHSGLSALLKPEIEAPELTHILTAAVYLPFVFLQDQIEWEIDQQEFDATLEINVYYRRQTEKAYRKNLAPLLIKGFFDEFSYAYKTWNASEEEWKAYFKEEFSYCENIISFDEESTDIHKWIEMVDELAHFLILPDDEDWTITSYLPQFIDGVGQLGEMLGISDEYMTNRLPKVTQEQFEQALAEIQEWRI